MKIKKFIQDAGRAMLAVVMVSLFVLVCLLCLALLVGAAIGTWRVLR